MLAAVALLPHTLAPFDLVAARILAHLNYKVTLEVRQAKHDASGLWFPAEWVLQSVTKRSQHGESGTVTVESLNAPLPREAFTLDSMNLSAEK